MDQFPSHSGIYSNVYISCLHRTCPTCEYNLFLFAYESLLETPFVECLYQWLFYIDAPMVCHQAFNFTHLLRTEGKQFAEIQFHVVMHSTEMIETI